MEITKVFKACVKAAKMRRKDHSGGDILPRKSRKETPDSFNSRAFEVVSSITNLKQFLLKFQAEYLSEFSPISSTSSITEEERDQIDEDAQTFIKSCSNAINKLKSEVNTRKAENNQTLHSKAVVELLETYLIDISKLYSQLRAFRVKQAVDRKQLSKLKPVKSSSKKEKNIVKSSPDENVDASAKHEQQHQDVSKKLEHRQGSHVSDRFSQNKVALEEKKEREEFQLTPEETQLFEEENDQLYNEMNHLVKEIQNIEGRVMEIGQLQEIFQEKVLSQSEQIESIHTTAVSTTENVKEGNEQIREAIKNSATFRVWILFFLVMCTFSLLFLDWYNP